MAFTVWLLHYKNTSQVIGVWCTQWLINELTGFVHTPLCSKQVELSIRGNAETRLQRGKLSFAWGAEQVAESILWEESTDSTSRTNLQELKRSYCSCQATLVWNHREGIQPHPSAENWIKDLLKMALPTSILIHQKADRMKTTVTEN